MAAPKDKGIKAQEAAKCFCTNWAWAGVVNGDPGDAESQLTKMLCHEKTDQPPRTTKQVTPQSDRVRRRAKKALKGLKKPRPKKRKQAVFNAMMTARQNPDQSPVPLPLWATGRRVPLDPSKSREPIPTDMWSNLHLDIKGEGAAGKGLEYCDLRFFDADPAQAVASTAPVFIKKGGAGSTAEPPGPVPTDWYKRVVAWFVEEYVLAHVNDNPCPTRDDSYAAARKKFPGWPIKRTPTWREDIWRNHAPVKWKKRGRK